MGYVISDSKQLDRKYGHFIFDIDLTLTWKDRVRKAVLSRILQLSCTTGIYHSFVTGRDAPWLTENFISKVKEHSQIETVVDKLVFFAEAGCVKIVIEDDLSVKTIVNPDLENHPIRNPEFRKALRVLTYDPSNPDQISPYKKGQRVEHFQQLVFDANKIGWLIDRRQPVPPCSPYVWSTYKEVFATLEIIRDVNYNCIRPATQQPYVRIVEQLIHDFGYDDFIRVQEVGSALNIVPVRDGVTLGKSWAAGMALLYIAENQLGGIEHLDRLIEHSIGFGDGRSDMEFSEPTFDLATSSGLVHKTLPFVFVGDEKDLPKLGAVDFHLMDHLLIRSTGRIVKKAEPNGDATFTREYIGPETVLAVLKKLDKHQHFIRL